MTDSEYRALARKFQEDQTLENARRLVHQMGRLSSTGQAWLQIFAILFEDSAPWRTGNVLTSKNVYTEVNEDREDGGYQIVVDVLQQIRAQESKLHESFKVISSFLLHQVVSSVYQTNFNGWAWGVSREAPREYPVEFDRAFRDFSMILTDTPDKTAKQILARRKKALQPRSQMIDRFSNLVSEGPPYMAETPEDAADRNHVTLGDINRIIRLDGQVDNGSMAALPQLLQSVGEVLLYVVNGHRRNLQNLHGAVEGLRNSEYLIYSSTGIKLLSDSCADITPFFLKTLATASKYPI